MRVLAADTSTSYCSVALAECSETELQVLSETTVLAGRRHSEILLSLSQDVLRLAGVGLRDVGLLAISAGPGSFTGLRVGVATWKGLAFGIRAPLIGVPTLRAMARRIGTRDATVCPILDARMNEVFAAAYRDGEVVMSEVVEPIDCVLDKLPAGAIVFGDGVLRYRSQVEASGKSFEIPRTEFHYPSAASVAMDGYEAFASGAVADAAAVAPIYLRKSQAEVLRKSSGVPVA